MHQESFLIVVALSIASMFACEDPTASELKVTAGIEISSDQYRSVVKLIRIEGKTEAVCTGTYISKELVLTAAHCLGPADSSNDIYVERLGEGEPSFILALATSRHPLYSVGEKISPHDLAIIKFESDDRSEPQTKLQSEPIRAGEPVTLVGFGDNTNFHSDGSLTGSGAGLKRMGTNKVFAVKPNGMIILSGVDGTESSESPLGVDVVSGNGDSGAPLFAGNSLAAIAVGGALIKHPTASKMRAVSYFVDLSRKENMTFISSMLAK